MPFETLRYGCTIFQAVKTDTFAFVSFSTFSYVSSKWSCKRWNAC